MIMKIIFKIIDWYKRETWWRKYYKRVVWGGNVTNPIEKCDYCDAADVPDYSKRACITGIRDCPCKNSQCLKFK